MSSRRLALAVGLTAALGAGGGLAYAQDSQTITLSASASANRAGSASDPAPFTPSFHYTATGVGGARSETPISWQFSWSGVVINGAGFPTCTAAKIDAAQSEASCPKASFLGQGSTKAVFGPGSDKTTNVNCLGKVIKFFNAGNKKLTVLIAGPAAQCAGVGYVPPATATISTVNGASQVNIVWPDNIIHPLPGLNAALPLWDMKITNPSRTSGGKKVYVFSSVKCTGKRTMRFITKDDEGAHVNTASIGACKK